MLSYDAYEAEQETKKRHLPECSDCGEKITDFYAYRSPDGIGYLCENCWTEYVNDYVRVVVETEEEW